MTSPNANPSALPRYNRHNASTRAAVAPQAATQREYEAQDVVASRLVGSSTAMTQLRKMVRRVAPLDAPVLLCGPSGSGKDVTAHAIHAASRRADAPFVAVNCGAIPAELIEAELFGHERGAFSGAVDRRPGLFEQATGGTLFLDEIGDMPLTAQVRLLRVLEDRRFRRVGGIAELPFSGRIICASHRDLPAAVAQGRFRADLWYRIAVLPIAVPALAERRGDISELARHLCIGAAIAPSFEPAAMGLLELHDWPGNVRELRNLLVRAAALYPDRPVPADAIPALLDTGIDAAGDALPAPDGDLTSVIRSVERHYVEHALHRCDGVIAAAARLLGVNRTTLVEKMRRLGIVRPAACAASQDAVPDAATTP